MFPKKSSTAQDSYYSIEEGGLVIEEGEENAGEKGRKGVLGGREEGEDCYLNCLPILISH